MRGKIGWVVAAALAGAYGTSAHAADLNHYKAIYITCSVPHARWQINVSSLRADDQAYRQHHLNPLEVKDPVVVSGVIKNFSLTETDVNTYHLTGILSCTHPSKDHDLGEEGFSGRHLDLTAVAGKPYYFFGNHAKVELIVKPTTIKVK